ncbi:MAG: demethoxyubiquinone hydroxylase family protein [Bacteroidia bacterium]|nr:demethoxyubiquinone hydroxylase family protein [Bacteroidia bacterium]MDW8302849.1 demethoxyubiquinone hydroxylase family protein [Bacteroidia bacterium]
MSTDIRRKTTRIIRDLHARESMRLGWYRSFIRKDGQTLRKLRERKSKHQAFLKDLLRKRNLKPAWYANLFYYIGSLLGWITSILPEKWAFRIERTLEWWILMRYKKYLEKLRLYADLRTMIEAVQLQKIGHNEPAPDVLDCLQNSIKEEEKLLQNAIPKT